jgi:hypothetical protein
MYRSAFLFILSCMILGCHEKATEHPAHHKTATDRLDDSYYNLRSTLTFPKSGISVPANVYILADHPSDAATAVPDISNMPLSSHFMGDDTLRVPYGTQCNLSVDQTQLFLNAGSKLVLGTQSAGATDVTVTGEVYVRTGAAHRCTVSVGNCDIKLLPDTRIHISAFEDEPAIRICLGAGTASVQREADTRVMHQADDAVVIDKATGVMELMQEKYADVTAWTQGKLHGENQSVAHICRQLSRLFDVPIMYSDTAVLRGIYSIPYRDFTLASILETLEKAKRCQTKLSHDSIFISPDRSL